MILIYIGNFIWRFFDWINFWIVFSYMINWWLGMFFFFGAHYWRNNIGICNIFSTHQKQILDAFNSANRPKRDDIDVNTPPIDDSHRVSVHWDSPNCWHDVKLYENVPCEKLKSLYSSIDGLLWTHPIFLCDYLQWRMMRLLNSFIGSRHFFVCIVFICGLCLWTDIMWHAVVQQTNTSFRILFLWGLYRNILAQLDHKNTFRPTL